MPIISVPTEESTPGLPSTGDNIAGEAILFGLALLIGYGIFRALFILLPLLFTVGCIGIVGYLGFKLL